MSTHKHKQVARLQQRINLNTCTAEQLVAHVTMQDKLAALVAHFAKPAPGVKAPYPTKEFANTTIALWLLPAGKGKYGDVRYTRSATKRGGKGVFVNKAHLTSVRECADGGAMYAMPLSAALTYGFIIGEEARI